MRTVEYQQLPLSVDEFLAKFSADVRAREARICPVGAMEAARFVIAQLLTNHHRPRKGETARPWEDFLDQVESDPMFASPHGSSWLCDFDPCRRVELSIASALYVLRGNRTWPPPPQVIERIGRLIEYLVAEAIRRRRADGVVAKNEKSKKLHGEILDLTIRKPYVRVPEVVFTTLLGCTPRSLAPRDRKEEKIIRDWVGDDSDIRAILQDMILVSVRTAYSMLRKAFQRFNPPAKANPQRYASALLLNFMSAAGTPGECKCAESARRTAVGGELRGNARLKHLTCIRQHSARAWDPWEMTFWMHERRFVLGSCRAFQFGAFPTGALYYHFHRDFGLVQANLAHFECPQCGERTWHSNSKCKRGHNMAGNVRVEIRKALILMDPALFVPHLCWVCRSAECIGPKGKGHVYIANGCFKCDCESHGPDCDRCSRCFALHPLGRQRKLSLVYFFAGSPALPPPSDTGCASRRRTAALVPLLRQ